MPRTLFYIKNHISSIKSPVEIFLKENFDKEAKGRCLLVQLYSIITALLSIIEKNDSGLFDPTFNQE